MLGVGESRTTALQSASPADVAEAALTDRAAAIELNRRRWLASQGLADPITEDDVPATPSATVSAMMAALSNPT